MSVADLVRRLQSRADALPKVQPDAGGAVHTFTPGANTGLPAVCTPEPASMLAIRPVFAPVALFAPEPIEGRESFAECAPAGAAAAHAEAAQVPAALFDEGQREAFDERAAIMEFDGGLSRLEADAAAQALVADGKASARVAQSCAGCGHFGRRRTCLEPVAAGLLTEAQGFGIVWPPEGHGAGCAAFIGDAARRPEGGPWRASGDQPRG